MAFRIPNSLSGPQSAQRTSSLIVQADGTWEEAEITQERRSLMDYDYRKVVGNGQNAPGRGGFRGGFPGGGFKR